MFYWMAGSFYLPKCRISYSQNVNGTLVTTRIIVEENTDFLKKLTTETSGFGYLSVILNTWRYRYFQTYFSKARDCGQLNMCSLRGLDP